MLPDRVLLGGDGGLYAELIRNRDFEVLGRGDLGAHLRQQSRLAQAAPPPDYQNYKPWQAVGSSAVLYLDNTTHPFATNPTTLAVRFSPTARGPAGVANPGFWGIPVPEQASSFNLSFYARAVGVDDGVPPASAGPDGFVRYPLEASLPCERVACIAVRARGMHSCESAWHA